jgi:hypothetical protein
MTRKKYSTKKIWLVTASVICLFLAWVLYAFKYASNYPPYITLAAPDNFWGVTYSKRFASFLNVGWKENYLAILNDLGAKNIRLPIYWQDVEPREGEFDFKEYDWMLEEGAKKNAKFIIVIGRRLPRWPECHVPDWGKDLEENELRPKIKNLLTTIVARYKDRKEIIAWQVENEPLLDSFGVCPPSDETWLKEEVALVKSLDSRPILITASGELSSWRRETKAGDLFGTTLYRVVWSPTMGYLRWWLPDWFYRAKLEQTGKPLNKSIIVELQAEPWAPNSSLENLPFKEAEKSLDIKQFRANLQYAINTGFKQSYLWGVEWWYMQKIRGNPEFWDEAKKLNW